RCGPIRCYGTCRRLTVHGHFVEKQRDRVEEIIGPPRSAAFTQEGKPTRAAKGFARSQGVAVDELEIIKTPKGEYVGVKKVARGKPSQEILSHILPGVLSSLTFPKMMRWGESAFRFSRPVKNILCLFGQKRLPFSLGGVSATDSTFGHKIQSPHKLKPKSWAEYKSLLKQSGVIIDQSQRRRMILKQMSRKTQEIGAELYPDEQLLEKCTYDVEYPYVFRGGFPHDYLKLPVEVLSTAMREGQSLFSLIRRKKQMPYFLGVADTRKDPRSLIRKGNERVLRARLEDAKFFWEQDSKIPMKTRMEELHHVLFQEKLGTYRDKTERLMKIVSYLAEKLGLGPGKKTAVEAAFLSKADLVTEMVREFPSLQGIVGGLYARKEGYPPEVWKAVYEQYHPQGLEDPPPSSMTGAILAIADKLDTIVGAMGIGVEATGSRDPFGLRRNAQGVCKIILEKRLDFSFSRLLDKVIKSFGGRLERTREDVKQACLAFFRGRLQHIFESQGFRYDLVKAALAPGIENIYHAHLRLKALDALKESPQFEPMILVAKRVNNILRGQSRHRLNEALLVEKKERELFTMFTIVRDNVLPLISAGDFAKAQRMVFRMRTTIDSFFDHVLVMAEDPTLRKNRLALLQELSQLLGKIADYSQVVIQG
ncbi:MAG: glycine--tRNA ligase subunit beta, partial [Candidatus Aminicenantales bacterium]